MPLQTCTLLILYGTKPTIYPKKVKAVQAALLKVCANIPLNIEQMYV